MFQKHPRSFQDAASVRTTAPEEESLVGETESGQDKRNLGMSHPENDRDPCAWFPLGLSLPFWEVGAYPGTWPGCWLGGRS